VLGGPGPRWLCRAYRRHGARRDPRDAFDVVMQERQERLPHARRGGRYERQHPRGLAHGDGLQEAAQRHLGPRATALQESHEGRQVGLPPQHVEAVELRRGGVGRQQAERALERELLLLHATLVPWRGRVEDELQQDGEEPQLEHARAPDVRLGRQRRDLLEGVHLGIAAGTRLEAALERRKRRLLCIRRSGVGEVVVGGEPELDEVAQGAIGHERGVAERLHCDRAGAAAGGEPPLDARPVVRLPRAQGHRVREDVQADRAPEQVRDAHLAPRAATTDQIKKRQGFISPLTQRSRRLSHSKSRSRRARKLFEIAASPHSHQESMVT
jgi:hypothetical protein